MTKDVLRTRLEGGEKLCDILAFRVGQECEMFKADAFQIGNEVLYIPDIDLNEIPVDICLSVDNSMMDETGGKWGSMTAREQIELALSYCYTGDDFVELCGGDVEMAERLFWYCDWQHPGSAYDEVCDGDEEDMQ